jgi:hypothetical protein
MKADGGKNTVDIICEKVPQKSRFSNAKIEKNPIVKREKSNFAINKHVHEVRHYLPFCIPVDR